MEMAASVSASEPHVHRQSRHGARPIDADEARVCVSPWPSLRGFPSVHTAGHREPAGRESPDRELTSSSESQMTAIYRGMEEHGHSPRELTVIVEGVQAGPRLRFVRPKAHVHPSEASVDWNRVFASCPNLLRLGLSYFPLTLDHTEPILDAALTHCVNLQAHSSEGRPPAGRASISIAIIQSRANDTEAL